METYWNIKPMRQFFKWFWWCYRAVSAYGIKHFSVGLNGLVFSLSLHENMNFSIIHLLTNSRSNAFERQIWMKLIWLFGPVPIVQSRLSCPGLSCPCCPDFPLMTILSRLSYHSCPVSEALSWLSCPVLLSHTGFLSCPSCPIQASCPSCPVPAVQSDHPVRLSYIHRQSCYCCPILTVLIWLSWV